MSRVPFAPDFIVIGAQKSGTTTLHEWLVSEGPIALPWPKKETHFFCYTERYEQGEAWYRACFPQGDYALRGEVDPGLMSSLAAPGRVFETAGDIPVAALLRDPISRAYSHYTMNVFKGRESVSFAEALEREVANISARDHDERLQQCARAFDAAQDSDAAAHGTYVWRGLYDFHLQRWNARFATVNLYTFEALFLNEQTQAATYQQLLSDIGYQTAPTRWNPERRDNRTESPRFSSVSRVLHDPNRLGVVKGAIKTLLPSRRARLAVQRAALALNSARTRVPPMPPLSELPPVALEMLAEDTQRLVARTGIDASRWSLSR